MTRAAGVQAGLVAALLGLAIAQVGLLAATLLDGSGASGPPPDFILVWAAGLAARSGEAVAFHDPAFAKTLEIAAAGRDFEGVYRWVYPPSMLLVAAPLSWLPLGPAQALFTSATFAAFAAVLARLAGWPGLLLALAWPASLACGIVGQNGFLFAAILGGGLLLADRRPVLGGLVLGLVALKPHLGILLPVALVAAGRWRVVAAVAASAVATAGLAALLFGADVWVAFVRAVPGSGDGLLGAGIMGFGKLQTAFGAARYAGLPPGVAWTLQGIVTLGAAALVWTAWRRPAEVPLALRVAAFAVGTALATPYLYVYDLPLVALALAVLLRLGPSRSETMMIGAAIILVFVHVATGAPAGFAGTLVVAALVFRRTLRKPRRAAQ